MSTPRLTIQLWNKLAPKMPEILCTWKDLDKITEFYKAHRSANLTEPSCLLKMNSPIHCLPLVTFQPQTSPVQPMNAWPHGPVNAHKSLDTLRPCKTWFWTCYSCLAHFLRLLVIQPPIYLSKSRFTSSVKPSLYLPETIASSSVGHVRALTTCVLTLFCNMSTDPKT